MRSRGSIPFLLFALVTAACTHPAAAPKSVAHAPKVQSPAAAAPSDLLVLGSETTIASLDARSSSLVYEGAAAPALGDWSQLFSATSSGGSTTVEQRSAASGIVTASRRIEGDLAIRAVSADGQHVALMAPPPAGASPWVPRPRESTDLVVADPASLQPAKRFHLMGNLEPEAFSTDGSGLFLIKYLPAMAPTSYRVVHLELADGDVYPVPGRAKTWQPKMAGTRLVQVPSAGGSRLYTLYTSQPPTYARGYDSTQAKATNPVAFIHTLSLDEGWAVCVGLPKALWGGDPSSEAIAVSPDGTTLYVVDTARGVVATLDTYDLRARKTDGLEFGSLAGDKTRAAVSSDGSVLYVAKGSSIMAMDARSFAVRGTWTMSGPVDGMGMSVDGARLYVAMPGHVALLDPATGVSERTIRTPDIAGLEHVAALTP
jgi:DNA-binding beta-propeller fold protein YncE